MTEDTVPFATQQDWRDWLHARHADPAEQDGLWVRIAKAGTGITSVTYADLLEVALCYGWIDGQKRGIDDRYWAQRFLPRRSRSRWSKVNRASAERLIEAGLMQPAGLREVAAARADGRWDAAYDSPATATVPDDLRAALDANPAAAEAFGKANSRNRYAILHRIQEAKRAETRARRIATLVAMLADGELLYP